MFATESQMSYILHAVSLSAPYNSWIVTEPDSFLQKAKENLCFAEEAKNEKKFDIEANRIYFALHQLACELVRLDKMTVAKRGKNVTPKQPYKIDHGSYLQEINKLIGNNADFVYSKWNSFRNMADYDHELIKSRTQWSATIENKRAEAFKVAEEIYGKLKTNS